MLFENKYLVYPETQEEGKTTPINTVALKIMKCQQCKTRIELSHSPGQFLGIAIASGVGAAVLGTLFVTTTAMVVELVLAVASLASLCGVWTEMIDASAPVYSKLRKQGVQCNSCEHINPIRPWSL